MENSEQQQNAEPNAAETKEESFMDDDRKSEFMKLKDGVNNVRLFTNMFRFMVHKIRHPNDTSKKNGGGWIVRCGGDGCPMCAMAKGKAGPPWAAGLTVEEAKPKWYVGAINKDISPHKPMILEIGTLIRNKVKSLAKSAKWGNPFTYDLEITKNPKDPPATFYGVNPDPTDKGSISPEDQVLIASFDVEDIRRRSAPKSVDFIKMAVDKYCEIVQKSSDEPAEDFAAASAKKKQQQKKAPQREPVKADEEDEPSDSSDPDFTFEQTEVA